MLHVLWEKHVNEENHFDILVTSKNNLNVLYFFPSKQKTEPVRTIDTCDKILFFFYF